MHEYSLIRNLLKQVDIIRRQHGAAVVTEVRVEIGPLSGVEPLLLSSAFSKLATNSTVQDAQFVIDEVALTARCQSCQHEFEMKDFVFRCPLCRGRVEVLRGHELLLVSVSLPAAESKRKPIAQS